MATESISCTACLGRGFTLLAGPHDVACSCCSGTGAAKCHDPACRDAATLIDHHGPTCAGCARYCVCGQLATLLVLDAVFDEHGAWQETTAESCEGCEEIYAGRMQRVKRDRMREACRDAAEDARGAA
jgi:hypothetical protein